MQEPMTGMEIHAIRRLARTMDDRADEIEGTLNAVTGEIRSLNWHGSDRERFQRDWESDHVTRLRRVAAGLRTAADQARAKANEQERISAAR